MESLLRFPVFILVSLVVVVGILRFSLRQRTTMAIRTIWIVAVTVVLGGMVFAKVGQNSGLPWWIYYTVPMVVTVLLPPVVFKMTMVETATYLVLSFLAAPLIHLLFSFFVGWKDYMPFLEIPSLCEMLGTAGPDTGT